MQSRAPSGLRDRRRRDRQLPAGRRGTAHDVSRRHGPDVAACETASNTTLKTHKLEGTPALQADDGSRGRMHARHVDPRRSEAR
jgi:homogentisate 1,2-dioxygenase